MKKVIAAIVIVMVSLPALVQSQVAEDLPAVLAVVNGVTITTRDIEKNTGESVRNLQRQVTEARKRELDLLINSKLLAAEAKKRGVSTAKLLEQEVVAKVKAPTVAEAQTFYDQNKTRVQGEFNALKEEILRYLLDERQRVEAKKFADGLRAAGNTDLLKVTPEEVEESLKPLLYEVAEEIYKL
ncbi:MAG TPA: hypothetical protein VFR78_02515, partial [Pyrinomonadaceae bacterium]|nr:hypothetical protein [Pyrinomonadaceae bacterium]